VFFVFLRNILLFQAIAGQARNDICGQKRKARGIHLHFSAKSPYKTIPSRAVYL
jgi:hypothetical protein